MIRDLQNYLSGTKETGLRFGKPLLTLPNLRKLYTTSKRYIPQVYRYVPNVLSAVAAAKSYGHGNYLSSAYHLYSATRAPYKRRSFRRFKPRSSYFRDPYRFRRAAAHTGYSAYKRRSNYYQYGNNRRYYNRRYAYKRRTSRRRKTKKSYKPYKAYITKHY